MPAGNAAELVLLQEARIRDLLPDGADGADGDWRYELSGIVVVGERLYVIFDDTRAIGVLHSDLSGTSGNRLVPPSRGPGYGYEDIAHDRVTGSFYALIESLPHGQGFVAAVDEYDADLVLRTYDRLEFPLPSANKGLEGLTLVRRDGEVFLLGLCEGNRCRSGKDGRRPGGGRVQVFARRKRHQGWRYRATLRLPESLQFEDYSSLSVSGDRITVASQESSALWVGRLAPDDPWRVDGEGVTYAFPLGDQGQPRYCTVEGVSWLDSRRVVIVSDKVKKDDVPKTGGDCRATQQSVHIFEVPLPVAGA